MFVGRSFLWFNPFWDIQIRGLENYDKSKPIVFIANHQSFLDMPLLATLPWQMKWVSKDALIKAPVLGWFMRMSGHISVKRGTAAGLNSLKKLKPYLSDGVPVMLFPEGTRSRLGELIKFKSGAFMIAKEMDVAVQPILIWGTRNVIKPDSWKAALKGKMICTLMEPIEASNFQSVEAFRDTVYETMKTELDRLEKISA
jgi:1-acyl-sn-glycerol-3-phosphate acyltransferase